VDAICINQSDKTEKAQQIPLMAEIYARASRVIVWLGEEEKESNQALDVIQVAAKGSINFSEIDQAQKVAVLELLKRLWFQRIWVRELDYNISRSN
jgi:ABC-type uncharacterized transport system substrate-binding protein